MGKWDHLDFDHTYRPPSFAPEPKPLYEYEAQVKREHNQPDYLAYDGDDWSGYLRQYEREVREKARELREEADREWRAGADYRRAREIYETQPTPQEFVSLLRRELEPLIKKHGLRAELLEPFLAVVPEHYEHENFRFPSSSPIQYLEYMATRGPKLLTQGLTELFMAYASRKPAAARVT